MKEYIKLKDIRYSLYNIGKIILLKPDSDGDYTIKEEIKLSVQFSNSKQYNKLYVDEITPYYDTVVFDKSSIRVDVKLQITVIEIEDDAL